MSEQKRTLSVDLQCRELGAAEIHGGNPLVSGSFIVLTVGDNGSGMDKATMDRIFEPYFTTKTMEGGTGLGLAVVHGIVEDCNGFIEVESVVGKGRTFSVYFPVVEEAADQPVSSGQKES